MELIKTIDELRKALKEKRREGSSVGFVPTMGFLHEGHASLIRRSAEEHGTTVVSIFINPSQFNEASDYEKYPKDLVRDSRIAEKAGATILFCPSVSEIYPEGYGTVVLVDQVTDTLCGASRPGHFRGVAGIVLKLFNIVQPDDAYFGQKDAQQVAVIRKMVQDLNVDVRVVSCPIIREEDGLAMSSRNVFLSEHERSQAAVLPQALDMARRLVSGGLRSAEEVKGWIAAAIREKELARIDYVEIVDINTMQPINEITDCAMLALAVRFGETRLIDNEMLEVYN